MIAILVRGAGDVGSTVALSLYQAGHPVVCLDVPRPSHTRRKMSFTDALFDGSAVLDGVIAKRARSESDVELMLSCHRAIPVYDGNERSLISTIRPHILIDARMRKHQQPESLRGAAPLTIGLGPGFVAPDITDVAVETAWGLDLGKTVRDGRTLDQAGGPRSIAGHGRDRFVYAPISGTFSTTFDIGERVASGERVATIGNAVLYAPTPGILRGLTHDQAAVVTGTKVIEVDPRERGAQYAGLGERPRKIAEAVLRIVAEESVAGRF